MKLENNIMISTIYTTFIEKKKSITENQTLKDWFSSDLAKNLDHGVLLMKWSNLIIK